MSLAVQPACQPLLPAELPHTRVADALALIQQTTPGWITCPRLPRRAPREHLHVQSMQGYPGSAIPASGEPISVRREALHPHLNQLGIAYLQNQTGKAGLSSEESAALAELLRMPLDPQPHLIIFQLAGPISLGLQITDDAQRPLIYDNELLDALVQHLALRVGWLEGRLKALARQVLIELHEGFIGALGTAFCPLSIGAAMDTIEQVLVQTSVLRGLTLGSMDGIPTDRQQQIWRAALAAHFDLLACSGASVPVLASLAHELNAYLRGGGALVWHLVPAENSAAVAAMQPDLLVAAFTQSVEYLAVAGVPPELLRARSFISTTSGMARLSGAEAQQVAQHCAALSRQLAHATPVPTAAIAGTD